MPTKRQKSNTQSTSPAATTTSRRLPDSVRFFKFRTEGKTSFPLRSGDSLTVLHDRIRTFIWDPHLDPASLQKAKEAADKVKTKGDIVGKINIEIPFTDIEQIDIIPKFETKHKLIVIFTKEKKPIKSAKGHVLSQALYFVFWDTNNETLKDHGRVRGGGIEDFDKMWKALEIRGIEVVTASSPSHTSPQDGDQMSEDEIEGNKDRNDDTAGILAVATPTPSKKNRKRVRRDTNENPFDDPVSGPASTASSLLEGEMRIQSSQLRSRFSSKASVSLGDEEEDENDMKIDHSLPRKSMKITAAGKGKSIEKPFFHAKTRELEACLKQVTTHVVNNWSTAKTKAKIDGERLEAKLWREIRKGVEKANDETLRVARQIKDNEAHFQLHGKKFRIVLHQSQDDMTFFITELKKGSSTLSSQRNRLLQLKAPVQDIQKT